MSVLSYIDYVLRKKIIIYYKYKWDLNRLEYKVVK